VSMKVKRIFKINKNNFDSISNESSVTVVKKHMRLLFSNHCLVFSKRKKICLAYQHKVLYASKLIQINKTIKMWQIWFL
jgi:hypothetical protein